MSDTLYDNPLVYSAYHGCVYQDDLRIPSRALDIDKHRLVKLMDARKWVEASGALGKTQEDRDRAASVFTNTSLADCFFGPLQSIADDKFRDLAVAQDTRDKDLAASIVTSQDYQTLQSTIIIGEQAIVTESAVLLQPFEEVQVPTLRGDWLDVTGDVEFHTNVPEGHSVRPSKDTATSVPVSVQKNMGAVAITEMAEAVINVRPVFTRLVSKLGQARVRKEDEMLARLVDTATNTTAGVDVGLRSGTPPLSSTVPKDMWTALQDEIAALEKGPFDTVISAPKAYEETRDNDTNKGVYTPYATAAPRVGVSPAPGIDGVTWYRSRAIEALSNGLTKLWVMNASQAIKLFRSFTRSYEVVKVEEEYRTQYLKSFFTPMIVDFDAIIEVTGVTA
jgi:hypothetical protein